MPFPWAEVVESAFESWRPPRPALRLSPRLPGIGSTRLCVTGERGGFFGRRGTWLFGGAARRVRKYRPFFAQIQGVYDEIGEGRLLPPGELVDNKQEVEESDLFEDVSVRHFEWDTSYDGEGFVALLGELEAPSAHLRELREKALVETLLVHDDPADERVAYLFRDPLIVGTEKAEVASFGEVEQGRLVGVARAGTFLSGATVRLVPANAVCRALLRSCASRR